LLTSDLENICEDVMAAGCAWTFETGNVASLRDRLTELVELPELAADLRKRCRDTYLESYSPAADLVRLERTYDEVCAEVARGA
jgi:glycosyltransferase involved in cell wall biosynthesis